VLGQTLRLRCIKQQRQRLKIALARYGPQEEINRLARQLRGADHSVHVVCLSTDIENYTQHLEHLSPAQAQAWLNAYWAQVFPIVRAHGGHVLDHTGDAMMCIWLCAKNLAPACCSAMNAALALHAALNHHDTKLTRKDPLKNDDYCTRIGVHFGPVALGDVGDAEHAQQHVVGDIVNTTSRIESANKSLGTQVLISQDVAQYINCTSHRALGSFLFTGKSHAVQLIDPLCLEPLCQTRYAQALQAYQSGQWDQTEQHLAALLAHWPHDGPALFLQNQLSAKKAQANPRPDGQPFTLHLK
jgi:adenylate cyclase